MKVKTVAKVLIINDTNEVLMLRRSSVDERRPGELDYPGGGVDRGEDITAGACREVLEEVGITRAVEDLYLIYAGTQIVGSDSVTRLLYWTRLHDPAITLSFEHSAYQWTSLDIAVNTFPHPFYSVGLRYALQNNMFKLS